MSIRGMIINPKHAGAYYTRGQAYLNKGQHDQAIADYNKALEIDPKFTEAYNGRGLSYAAKAEYDQALSDYNKALEINSKYAEAYYNKALVYEKLGRKEVIEAYENFIKYASDQYASLVEQTKQRIKEVETGYNLFISTKEINRGVSRACGAVLVERKLF